MCKQRLILNALRAIPRNVSWGGGECGAYILPIKMGMVPMIEEYMLVREDFVSKCINLTSFSLCQFYNIQSIPLIFFVMHLILLLRFLQYKIVKQLTTEIANLVIFWRSFSSRGVTPLPQSTVGTGMNALVDMVYKNSLGSAQICSKQGNFFRILIDSVTFHHIQYVVCVPLHSMNQAVCNFVNLVLL